MSAPLDTFDPAISAIAKWLRADYWAWTDRMIFWGSILILIAYAFGWPQ
jgi:hypothetical protein